MLRIPIGDPLPNITVHVVETKRVRSKATHGNWKRGWSLEFKLNLSDMPELRVA